MFFGRAQELQDLQELKSSRVASFVVLKGRRRVGKSTLVFEYGKTFENFYHFSGLPPGEGISQQDQKKEVALKLEKHLNVSGLQSSDWSLLFDNMGHLVSQGEALLFLDEISWMAKGDATFLPKLKTAWDVIFKRNPKLVLIVCSSISSWVDTNLLSNTGFVGRVTLEKQIAPLPLADCLKFWPKGVSETEKLEFLSAVGGIPRYLEEIQPHLTAEANLRRLFFRADGLLFNEFERIFSDLFSERAVRYRQVVNLLRLGRRTQSQLVQELELSAAEVGKLLKELVLAGFVKRDFTWNIGKSGTSRLSNYRVSDNYVRFYLRHVHKRRKQIVRGLQRDVQLHQLPGWHSSLGHGFENLVLENAHLVREALGILPQHVVDDGPYFQLRNKRQASCQIDYLIETEASNVYLCEIKYSSNRISEGVIEQARDQQEKITLPKRTSVRSVLIYFGELPDAVQDSGVFSSLINFEKFLR